MNQLKSQKFPAKLMKRANPLNDLSKRSAPPDADATC